MPKFSSTEPEHRLRDPGKNVGGCDGYFEPPASTRTAPMRIGKTTQDRMAREDRPRVKKAKARTKRMRKG